MNRFSLLCVAAVAGVPVQAAEPSLSLTPAGAWKVDYGASTCTLSRQFTGGGQTYVLQLTQQPVIARAWLRLASPEKVKQRDDGDARLTIDGAELPQDVHFNVFANTAGGTTREFLLTDIRSQIGGARQSLRLEPAKYGTFDLDLKTFDKAMHALDTCMADLHRSLGVDPALLQSIAVAPKGEIFAGLPSIGQPYDLSLLYWVNSAGRIDECKVVRSSGIAELDDKACAVIQAKAKFEPARNAAGAAVRAPLFEEVNMRVSTVISDRPL